MQNLSSRSSCFWCLSFANRDMFMQFRGGGIGHRALREASQQSFHDNDVGDDDEIEEVIADTGEGHASSQDLDAPDPEDGEREDAVEDEDLDYGYYQDEEDNKNAEGEEWGLPVKDKDEEDMDEVDIGAEDGEDKEVVDDGDELMFASFWFFIWATAMV